MRERYRITVAYDGTEYSGWQLQDGANTIEGVLNRELSRLLKQEIRVIGASRTDAGVHSLGNIAVFDAETSIPAEKICYALNPFLPEDIVVTSSRRVDADYHPRRVESKKTYMYKILHSTFAMPTLKNDTLFLHGRLDVELMREAAKHFVGEHDFVSFCAAGSTAETTVRTVYSSEVIRERAEGMIFPGNPGNAYSGAELIKIIVSGNGFLYNMVRIIAGTLIEVGRGRIAPDGIPDIINARDRAKAGPTAPALGLTHIGTEEEV